MPKEKDLASTEAAITQLESIPSAESSDALDKLFAETQPDPEAETEMDEEQDPPATAADEKEEVTAEDDPPKEEAEETPAGETEESTGAPGKDDAPAGTPESDDPLERIQLGPYARPKTAEQFAEVKRVAREEYAKRDARIAELEAQVSKLNEDLAIRPAPEVNKELEELRTFRRAFDIESDPEFKQYDVKRTDNDEFIYSRLREFQMPEESIDKIKALGTAKVHWDPILAELPSNIRRTLEAKLVDNENISDQKKKAIAAAKAQGETFLSERSKKAEQEETARTQTVQTAVDSILKDQPWANERPVPKDAKEQERKEIEAHNAFAKQMRDVAKAGLSAKDPQTMAELIAGTTMAHYFSRVAQAQKTQLEDVTKQLKAAQEELAKIKKASGLPRSSAASAPHQKPKPKGDIFNTRTEDALDAHFEEITRR